MSGEAFLLIFMRFLLICLGTVLMCQGAFACTNPTGAAGEIIFNTDHKVLQYCDGVDWLGVGKNNELAVAHGKTGALQLKGSDDKFTSTDNLYFDTSKNVLNIALGGYSFDIPTIKFLTSDPNDSGTIGSASWGWGRGTLQFNACNAASTGACTIVFNNKNTVHMRLNRLGNTGIGLSSNLTERLQVGGNIQVSTGHGIKMDVIRISANPLASPIAITPSGTGVTCSNVTGTNANTRCTCPSGYNVISGGGHIASGYMRESRPLTTSGTNVWITACANNSHTSTLCNSIEMVCARILAN